jgi:hypothetical protein
VNPNSTSPRMPAWLEQAWLGRYLDRQLTGDEIAWFEAYVLDKWELLDMIEADTQLRDALTADSTAGRSTLSAATETHPQIRAISANDTTALAAPSGLRLRRARHPWMAIAAASVLGLGIGGIGVRSLTSNRDTSVIASPTRIIYDTMRGEPTPPRVEHADSTAPYLLVEVAVPPGAQSIVLHVDALPDQTLSTSPDGFVSFLIARGPASDFAAQITYSTDGKQKTQRLSYKTN